jgi:hypothetical protein
MAREDAVRRRLDPSEALPGGRTLVVATLGYARAPDLEAGDDCSRIAGAGDDRAIRGGT